MAIEQLAHRAYPTLPKDHIKREAGKAFAVGVEDPDIKIQLLLGGKKTVDEALRQALELQALLLAARPHKTRTKTFWGSRSSPTRGRDARQSGCWSCGEPGHIESNCPDGKKSENYRRGKHENSPSQNAQEFGRFERRPRDNREKTMACQQTTEANPETTMICQQSTEAHPETTMACQETTEANPETTEACQDSKEPSTEEMESEVESREVPTEEAIVKSSRTMKKRHRGRRIAAGRRGEPKELTRGNCGSRGMLAAACRKVSRRATVTWRKRNVSRKIRTQGSCGSRHELGATRIRMMTLRAKVALRKGNVVRKYQTRDNVIRGTLKKRAFRRRHQLKPERKNGIRNRGLRQ
jgi:hypothetical protein